MAKRNRIGTPDFMRSMFSNERQFNYYLRRCSELAISMFQWENLPDSIDQRFLELNLFERGSVVFFEDDILGLLALPVMLGGTWNVYNVPNYRRAYASNGYQQELTPENSVVCYNNMLRTNTKADAELYAYKLWDIDTSVLTNARAQKTPILLQCDENKRLSLLQVYKQYDGNEPVIYGDRGLNPNDMTVLSTEAPYVADKLMELKSQIWNEYLTYLGVPSMQDKRERLLQTESTALQAGSFASRSSRLVMRQQAAEAVNKMFGTHITVDYRIPTAEAEELEDTQENLAEGGTGDE